MSFNRFLTSFLFFICISLFTQTRAGNTAESSSSDLLRGDYLSMQSAVVKPSRIIYEPQSKEVVESTATDKTFLGNSLYSKFLPIVLLGIVYYVIVRSRANPRRANF